MKAIFYKETEKAVNMKMQVHLGESIMNIFCWMPKSQIEVKSVEGDVMSFMPKSDWILTAKVKDSLVKKQAEGFHLSCEEQNIVRGFQTVDLKDQEAC